LEIITSHNVLDFDGLASMVAAAKLYPGAVRVFPGTVNKNVKKFMALYKDLLLIKTAKEIDLVQVQRLVLVDTASPDRLAQLKPVLANASLDIHIFDHHLPVEGDLRGSLVEIHPTGAATTILVEKIIEQNIQLSPFEATILALGIYDDTGSLLFPSTTSRDAYAVAHLLSRGANLMVVGNFMEKPFSEEQRQILHKLLEASSHHKIHDLDVVLAIFEGEAFVPGLDLVTYRLFEVQNCDAVFVIVRMEGKVNVVGRSHTNSLKINEALSSLGGRGHDKAASAMVRSKTCYEVKEIILANLQLLIHPAIVAQDIMSSPVKTLLPTISMEEAGGIMLRYGHTGMPVVEQGLMVGVISRRDVDKSRIHELGHAPVKGFMTTDVLSVTSHTPVSDIQKLMVEHDIGRLPVIDEGKLTGIVSRTDIIRTLHGEDYPEDHELLYAHSEGSRENCARQMEQQLPAQLLTYLRVAGEISAAMNSTVYCVGGFVRDLLLQVANFDVDLVVEGDGRELASQLALQLGAKLRIHERFGTAVVMLPDGSKIDVATARTEYYEFPAALPQVERSSLKEDMYRRDFTINTLAVCLNPDHFGELIDYFGGRKDIHNGLIRILYNFSFVEDPTRILRAIRFEQRYQFEIEADTMRFARDAIERRMLGKLSYKRILAELILILNEKDPIPALARIRDIGVWKYILPEIEVNSISWNKLKRLPLVTGWWNERYYGQKFKVWILYFIIIFAQLHPDQSELVLQRYPLDRSAKRTILDSSSVPQLAAKISNNRELCPSDLDKMISALTNENRLYLLLCIKDEGAWDRVSRYLDLKEKVRVEINGNNLRELGLKPGPAYKQILAQVYDLKLDEKIKTQQDEIKVVKQWIEEGRIPDAVRL
jgi:tRNA nucleotidyltransferase (CCA-adding enzyme)